MRELLIFTILHELTHFIVGSVLAVLFWRRFHKWTAVFTIFAATFLLDLDHLFDYFYFTQNFRFWEYFGRVDFFTVSNKSFVPVHSWEMAILLGILGWVKRLPIVLAISLALMGHLVVDQLSYTPNPLAYFLTFRALNNFSLAWYNGL